MQLVMKFVFFASIVKAFFSFIYPNNPTENPFLGEHFVPSVENRGRGIPPSLSEQYLNEIFVCDNGKTRLTQSEINDNYCDCVDGTDEPGTSACPSGSFYCLNSGYRMLKIPNSRVDDGVCDCCDGSDEGYSRKCQNTCGLAAEKEREMIEKLTKDYKKGNALKSEVESRAMEELSSTAQPFEQLTVQLHQIEEQLRFDSELRETTKQRINDIYNKRIDESFQLIRTTLNLQQFNPYELSTFMVTLFNLVGLNDSFVDSSLTRLGIPLLSSNPNENISNENGATEEKIEEDEIEYNPANYDDEDELNVIQMNAEEEENQEISETTSETTSSSPPPAQPLTIEEEERIEKLLACPLLPKNTTLETADSRLKIICSRVPSYDTIVDLSHRFLIEEFIKEKQPYLAVQAFFVYIHNNPSKRRFHHKKIEEFTLNYLVGHSIHSENMEEHMLEADSFCRVHYDEEDDEPPSHISKSTCSMAYFLEDEYHAIRMNAFTFAEFQSIHHPRSEMAHLHQELKHLETSVTTLETRQRELGPIHEAAKEAKNDLERYQSNLALYVYRNECVESNEGKYKYVICLGNQITQSDPNDTNSVSLGRFENFEQTTNQGRVILHYKNGQHCWNHGDRVSQVTMTCGEKNVIKSASEPSVCSYVFEMESPIACGKEFAIANGLQI